MNYNKDKRNRFFYVFIGSNRTGKSITARKHIVRWKKNNPGKLVVGFDPQHRFTDLLDIIIDPENENWALDLHQYRDVLVVIDEFRELHEQDKAVPGLKKWLYNRDEWGHDIIGIFHNPSLVLKVVVGYANFYFIFHTNVEEGGFKAKIPNYRLCTLASKEVNNYVAEYGKGTYKDATGKLICDFPHIVVNTEEQSLSAINMMKK